MDWSLEAMLERLADEVGDLSDLSNRRVRDDR